MTRPGWPDTSGNPPAMRPSDRVATALDRIDALDAQVRAWVVVDREHALRAAMSMDREPNRGPLWGVPFGVKDVIDVAGLPTECGSAARRGHTARRDAWIVAQLRAAGAVPVGKTVTTEFAYFSPGPTRNPRDLTRTPGGSSSGSAAAVAAGMVPLAVGTQTAGSVTRPAAFCGVASYVAPRGTLPADGIVGMCPSLDSPGLFAGSTVALQAVYTALTGEGPSPLVRPPRLAVWDGSAAGDVSADMLSAVSQVWCAAASAGATLEPLAPAVPVASLVDAHATVMAYEAARSSPAAALPPHLLSSPLRDLLTAGRQVSDDAYRSALARAQATQDRLTNEWRRIDGILAPGALGAAPLGLASTGSPVLSRPWQLLGLPAVAIPGRVDGAGAPLGIQVIGHTARVGNLLAVAGWLEQVIAGS